MTLLEKAKAIPVSPPRPKATEPLEEQAQLALAYAKGIITSSQYVGVVGCRTSNGNTNAASILFRAIRHGVIKAELAKEAACLK